MLSVTTAHTRTHTHTKHGTRILLQVIEMFITLTVVIVSRVYAYAQTHQIVDI